MIPGLHQLILKYAPIEVLNHARLGFLSAYFVQSPEMRKDLVIRHIIGSKRETTRSFMAAYWGAVHAGVIQCEHAESEGKGVYKESWIGDLLDRWNEMGLLPYLRAGEDVFIKRSDLRQLFKEHGIAFPVTWR